MASELAEKAKEAIIDDDLKLALDLYSRAIELDSTNGDYFADRAQANIKLNNFTEAVADANKAIELASSIPKAYLRKGVACMKLEEYHTAKRALEIGASLAQDDSRFTNLIKECDLRIAEDCYDQRKSLAPNVQPTATPASVGSCQKETISSGKPKYSHEYYQKPEEVILTIFAKGIPAENVTVDFGEQILSVNVSGEDTYHFQPRLFGKVLPDRSKYQVLSTKIEIRFVKAEVINWTSLEYCKEITVPQKINVPSVGSQRPSHPSSKSRAKDWDKLEAEVKKEVLML
uniref:Protein SGT1 homolog n=1 Tax=Manihot esculenta TaxID=3983 RepID=A0A2C9WAC2_MANES